MFSGANSLTPVGSLRVAAADDITARPCDADVGNGWRANVFDTAVVISTGAEVVEEPFAGTQQDRRNHKMHLIDQRSTKVLPDGGRTASDKDILIPGRFGGCAESCFDPALNEMKGCS